MTLSFLGELKEEVLNTSSVDYIASFRGKIFQNYPKDTKAQPSP
jgi:hypothetical protein